MTTGQGRPAPATPGPRPTIAATPLRRMISNADASSPAAGSTERGGTDDGFADSGLAEVISPDPAVDSPVAALARKLRAAAEQADRGMGTGRGRGAMGSDRPIANPSGVARELTPRDPRLNPSTASTTASTRPAAHDEHRAGPQDRSPREVFVSPRVIDQRAFSELAGELRGLIRDAEAQRVSLAGAENTVQGIQAKLREATGELRQRLEIASKLAPTIDDKLARCERAVDAANRTAERAATIEPRLEALIQERIEAASREAEARVAALEDRLAKAEQRAQQAEQRAASVAEALAGARREHEEAASALVSASLNEMDERLAAMAERVDDSIARTDARRDELSSEIDACVQRAAEAMQALAGRGLPGIDEVTALCERAERALGVGEAGTDTDGTPRTGSLRAAAEDARALTGALDATRAALETARERADESRTHLGHALIATAERLKRLGEDERELAARAGDSAKLAAEARSALEHRAAELRELLDAPVKQIGVQVEQAGRWLGEIIREADDRGRALSQLVEQISSAATDADAAARADHERDATGRFRRVS